MYTHILQNSIGSRGNSGAENGRSATRSCQRRTNSDKPVSRKKTQNTGAVPATSVSKPPK